MNVENQASLVCFLMIYQIMMGGRKLTQCITILMRKRGGGGGSTMLWGLKTEDV